MLRVSTIALVAALFWAIPGVSAAPLEIPPAPMLWAMPDLETAMGTANFLANRALGVCSFCLDCGYELIMIGFWAPGPIGRIPGCGVVLQDGLIETTRLETIRLPSIGSTATIPIVMRSARFTQSDLRYCYQAPTRVTAFGVFAAVGSMVVRRDNENGGVFTMHFNLSIDFSLQPTWPPNAPANRTILGPYAVSLSNIRWRSKASTASICQRCCGDFSVEVTSGHEEWMFLQGSGTSSPVGGMLLDHNGFALPLYPVCSVGPTSVHQGTWSTIKELFR